MSFQLVDDTLNLVFYAISINPLLWEQPKIPVTLLVSGGGLFFVAHFFSKRATIFCQFVLQLS